MKHGKGLYEDETSKYEGNWVSDQRHGKGRKSDKHGLKWHETEYYYGRELH